MVFLDSNPASCRQAEEAGFTVVFGNALQERTLLRARFEGVGAAVGATPNQVLNSVFVTRARERFSVPQGYVAVARPEAGLAPELVAREEAVVLFDGPHDAERWDVRTRHGDVDVEQRVYQGPGEPPPDGEEQPTPQMSERFVILALRSGGRTLPMHAARKLQEGDVAVIAIHRPESDEAHAALEALGWEPVPESEDDERAAANA